MITNKIVLDPAHQRAIEIDPVSGIVLGEMGMSQLISNKEDLWPVFWEVIETTPDAVEVDQFMVVLWEILAMMIM